MNTLDGFSEYRFYTSDKVSKFGKGIEPEFVKWWFSLDEKKRGM